ncbi:MAG TPA: VWA domain-containing protein [Pyrinomonadaceae bacterium]|nr:VWA domain-containing protein [Pyrinomonadaceae bacterium]
MNPRRPSHAPRPPRTRHALQPLRTLCLVLFTLALAPTPARAQTPPAGDDEVLSVRTDLITVNCFVTDSHNRRVGGLAAADFQVRDNGRPAAVSYFASGATRVALVFALDASGSAREHIERQREAALALFERFGKGSRAAVLAFAERPALALPLTSDAEQVRASFRLGARSNLHTAIFDAALAAVRAFDSAKPDPAERRIVLLLSDGLDNASDVRPATVVEEANARGVSFYVIHFPLYEPAGERIAVRRPSRGFRELAGRTGGAYFLLGDIAHALDLHYTYDLAPVFNAIADDLQSQYVVGFYLDEAARKEPEHRLEINLAQNRKLRVHTLRDRYVLKP